MVGIPKIRGAGQGDNLVGLHILGMLSTEGFIHCKAQGKGYYKLEYTYMVKWKMGRVFHPYSLGGDIYTYVSECKIFLTYAHSQG